MSYDQTFRGSFVYADAHCLEAGLDRFAARVEDSIVTLGDLEIDAAALKITIDMDSSAPASMYDETTSALRELASEAKSGSLTATFTMDSTDRERVSCGRRSSSRGLAPRHYRWDLYFAAKADDVATLRELGDRGVALGQALVGYYGWSALHVAAQAGAAAAVALLLEAGLDPNAASSHGTRPLALAKTAEVARRLLAAGADKDGGEGDSAPIAVAYNWDRWDVAELLLDAGATVPESELERIVDNCVRSGQVGALQRLAKHAPSVLARLADPERMDNAIASGEPVLVDYLLDHGAKLPDALLEAAVRSGSLALTETALRMPGSLDRCGSSSRYDDPMCVAAFDANLAILQRLADYGAAISPAEPGETSPLHRVAYSSEPSALDCASWLLERGAPIDAPDEDGKSPLTSAAEGYRTEMAILLLEHGANPSALAGLSRAERASLKKAMGEKWAVLVGKPKPAKKRPKPPVE